MDLDDYRDESGLNTKNFYGYIRIISYFCAMFRKGVLGFFVGLAFSLYGSEMPADSVRPPHVLREVEVFGLKVMPSTNILPVTKLGRPEITRLGIENVRDISDIVPNLFSPSYGSRMTSSIYMRGLGSRIDQAVVGLTIDGVPFLNKDAYDFDLSDMSLVEVHRGAQSVLNGRNAMAGQINILTLSPRDYQGWRFMAEYGKANSAKISAGGYFKISDALYSSLSLLYGHTDGFYRNEFNNKLTGLENNGSARWKIVWAPSKALSLTNTAAFSMARQGGYAYADYETGRIVYNDTCFYRRNAFSDGITLAWAGKRVVVTSLTSVQYLDDNLTLDQDFTPKDYFTLTQARKEWTFTEDLFAKGSRGKYQWMGGVTGFYRHSKMNAPVTFYDTGISELIEKNRNEQNPYYPIHWDNREFPLLCNFNSPSGGFAIYHQSVYKAGRWTFEAGVRWDIEHVECRYDNNADATYSILHDEEVFSQREVSIHDRGKLSQTFNQILPKAVIAYEFPFMRAYASFTKGYKSGGFNCQMFSDVLQQQVMETMGIAMQYDVEDIIAYKPETSWNYEVGINAHFLDNRLQAELVGFYIDCRNQQLTMFPPGTVTGRIMTNAGKTRSIGAELSATYNIDERWRFSATYGYTNAKFREYFNGREDFKGKRVPYAPKHTLFASATWITPWKPGKIKTELSANLRGTGNIMWNEQNDLCQPFYLLPGASFTLRASTWSLKLWGENLSNTHYNTFYFLSMGNSFIQKGNPITFGATFRLNIYS